jgi:RHS repeat-associated protein
VLELNGKLEWHLFGRNLYDEYPVPRFLTQTTPFGEDIQPGIGNCTSLWGPIADNVNQKFTGKERDAESGLDYFGARYYGSALGRFASTDLLGINLIRVLNPQRLHKYAYAVNNPLAFTDPDGKDAIVFKTLAGGAGHAAVISVHPDGSATFGSYGPRGGGKPVWPGEYVVQPLATKVKFGSDGTPLPGSFSVLTGEVADLEKVDPSSVNMAYFRTSDAETAALDQYLNSVNGTASLYVVGIHDWFVTMRLPKPMPEGVRSGLTSHEP